MKNPEENIDWTTTITTRIHQHYNEVRPDSFLTLLYPLKLFNSSSEFWPSYKSITRRKKNMFQCSASWHFSSFIEFWDFFHPKLNSSSKLVGTPCSITVKWKCQVPSISAENPVGKSLFWLPSSNTVILTWFLAKITWGLLPPVVTLLPHQRASKPLFSRSTSMYAPSHSTVCGALKLWNVASKYNPGSVWNEKHK